LRDQIVSRNWLPEDEQTEFPLKINTVRHGKDLESGLNKTAGRSRPIRHARPANTPQATGVIRADQCRESIDIAARRSAISLISLHLFLSVDAPIAMPKGMTRCHCLILLTRHVDNQDREEVWGFAKPGKARAA
jgi:hypothetical protein